MPFKPGSNYGGHVFAKGNKESSKAARLRNQAKRLGLPLGEVAINTSREEMTRQARSLTGVALKALIEALGRPNHAVAAATALLDRAWGKPQQHIVTTGSPLDSVDITTLAEIVEYFGIGAVSPDGRLIEAVPEEVKLLTKPGSEPVH